MTRAGPPGARADDSASGVQVVRRGRRAIWRANPGLYVDRKITNGTLLISTLDPIQHTSGRVIPETPHVLRLFLPWIVNDLLSRG